MNHFPNWYIPLRIDVPEGEIGNWRVEHFTVSEEDARFDNMRSSIRGSRRFCRPGNYTRLTRNGHTIMSDTVDEVGDMLEPIREAKNRGGDVLINGLGLGVVANGILLQDNVRSLTVVEISKDVIDLIGDYWRDRYGNRINIIHADAIQWKPKSGTRFSVVWHDIWDNICSDNLNEMKKLHRRYGKRCDWQGSWCRAECEYQAKRGY